MSVRRAWMVLFMKTMRFCSVISAMLPYIKIVIVYHPFRRVHGNEHIFVFIVNEMIVFFIWKVLRCLLF